MALTRGNKKLSALTSRMIPSVIREDKPNFEVFVKGFFKYLEKQGNPYDIITHIFEYGDIDETADAYVQYFKNTYTQSIPEAITTDFRFLIKNIKSFYRSKGSEAAFQFLLQFIWNTETSFYYPKVDILKTSDGTWTVPTFIRPKAYPPTDDMVFYLDTKIKGDVSGAEAYVDKLVFRDDPANPGTPIIHFQIVEPSLVGTFVNGEELTIIDANKDITSYTKISIDNISAGESGIVQTAGLWLDRSGFISDKNKLQDNYYYQDFSYVVVSQVSLKFYRETIKDLLHPAGYELFGAVVTPEDAPVSSDLLPQSSTEYLNVYEELFTSPVLLSQDAYMHISEIEETMGIDIHSLRVDVSRQSEVDSGAVSNSFYDNFVTNEDTVAVVMTLADLEKVAVAMAEIRLPGTYEYYELNREDPITSLTFKPCMIDSLPLSLFEDTPTEVMPWMNTNVIVTTPSLWNDMEESVPTLNANFGWTSAVTGVGDRTAAGVSGGNDNVTIFTIDIAGDGSSTHEQTLPQPSTDIYGSSDLDFDSAGDRLLVGYPNDSSVGTNYGSVEVWSRSGTTWTKEQTIPNPLAAALTGFGTVCAINNAGDTLVIGCPYYGLTHSVGTVVDQGAIYVYTRIGTTWSLTSTLLQTSPVAGDRMGEYVDIDDAGDRAIGACGLTATPVTQKTWVFDAITASWTQNNVIVSGHKQTKPRISGDGLVVLTADQLVNSAFGEAYVWEETAATVWTLRSTLSVTPHPDSVSEQLGNRLDIDATGDILIISAPSRNDTGQVVVFERTGATTWVVDRWLIPREPNSFGYFGLLVSVNDPGTLAIIGDPYNSTTLSNAGKIWSAQFVESTYNASGCSTL